jgi:hypothetical protein
MPLLISVEDFISESTAGTFNSHNESPENSIFILSNNQIRLLLEAVSAVDEADCTGFCTHDD